MDKNTNSYTFGFAAVMVVVVAALLSFTATSLKSKQDENVRLEKMQNILSSINVNIERDKAEGVFNEMITEQVVVQNGQEVSGIDAFTIDMSKELAKSSEERNSPLYIAEKDGAKYFIIPLRGKGLWGPIWGYISLKEDASTVYGATFDHKSESPGLGAEIKTSVFTDQFPGKSIENQQGEFVGIDVTKGNSSGPNQVDGISGGTITSDGVELMITDCVSAYTKYLDSKKAAI